MTESAARPPVARRRALAAVAVALGAAAFAAAVSAQRLVASGLLAMFPGTRDPVFPTPLAALVAQHLAIVTISSALTVAVGLPLGVWATRPSGRDFRDLISATVDFGQVFPPIAVLALMLPVLGLGLAPAVVALFLYGLFPVVSSTVAGLEAVPASVIDAARGVGMGRWRILFSVELPLAMGVVAAGVRTSVIINVGTATVAAATGAGGLGLPIFTGISTQNIGNVLEGALTVSLLAFVVDGALATLGMWLTPAGLEPA